MARLLGLPEHTLFAELIERSLDAMFDEQFPENGTFVERSVTNRDGASRRYWYYQGYRPGTQANETPKRYGRYVGLADDPMIAERVARFRDLKHARGERAQLVDALIGAGMPRSPVLMGAGRSQDGAGIAKSRKDIVQAGEVIEALTLADRLHLLAPALTEAWGRGPEWQRLVARGMAKLKPAARAILEELGSSFALWPLTTNSTDEVSDPSP